MQSVIGKKISRHETKLPVNFPWWKQVIKATKDTYYYHFGSVIESHNFSFDFLVEARCANHFSPRWNVLSFFCIASRHVPPVLSTHA